MVSIIVPVYNAEKGIRRCVDSILNQDYKEFELLLIDDGSKDSSGQICDEYAALDARVRVFHKENTGVSDTRNLGISKAQGEYLQFLDSDDWMTPDATNLLVRSAKEHEADLVISDFYRVVGERVSHKGDIGEDVVLDREAFAGHMMKNPADFYYGVLWNKLYRRDIVEKYQLRMDKNISWCEDFMFNLEYIRHSERFYALQVPIYYYVKTKGSLVNQVNFKQTVQMKTMLFTYYNNFYKAILDEEAYEKNRLQVYRFLVDAAGDGMVPFSIFPSSIKLGEERNSVSRGAVEGEGIQFDAYRDRKLLEHYLEPIAIKYALTMEETALVMLMQAQSQFKSKKELMEITGFSRSRLMRIFQKLASREIIKTESRGKITWLPASERLFAELSQAEADYERAKFAGFSEEELIQYAYLSNKIKENIQNVL